jgi:hypothetical protein
MIADNHVLPWYAQNPASFAIYDELLQPSLFLLERTVDSYTL